MKTKDLNFIEAYEAFKAGHDVYDSIDNLKMNSMMFENEAMYYVKNIVNKRFYIKQKPLRSEIATIIEKDSDLKLTVNGDYYGKISSAFLNQFIGRKCKITVEEIVE